MAYSTDDLLYKNRDPKSPDQFLLPGAVEPDAPGGAMVTCYVFIPKQEGKGRRAPTVVYQAIGRTARYRLSKLLNTNYFAPVQRPYVIRRDDGHEVTYG